MAPYIINFLIIHGLTGLLILIVPQNVFASTYNSLCFVNDKEEAGYDNQDQICCQNKTQTRLLDQDCCGNAEFFFRSKSLCCGSKLFNRFTNDCENKKEKCSDKCSPNDAHCTEQICCGEDAIIKSKTKCCYGSKIHLTQQHKTNLDFLLCCNETHLYDVRSEICCNKKVFQLNGDTSKQCCGDRTYSPKLNTCLTTTTSGTRQYTVGDLFEAVCGASQVYNRKFHGCCNGVVYHEPEMVAFDNIWRPNPNFQCCDHLFRRQNEKCCRRHHSFYFETHTIPNMPELDCCGTGYYNKSKELCNNGTKVPIQFDKERCGWGFEFYDPAKEECCGFEVYPKDAFQCCDDRVIDNGLECCNGVGLNSSYMCCYGLPAKKSFNDSDECCVSQDETSAETYNRKRGERCADGTVKRGYPENNEPCGPNNYFDPRYQICCNGEPYDGASSGCCDGHAYKKAEKTCCFDAVLNLSAYESSCCDIDGKAYRLNDTKNPCLEQCGSAYYDGSKEVCCRDNVYKYKRGFDCCGSSYINKKLKECCGDQQSFRKRGNMRCCDNRAVYSSTTHFCNSEGLIHLLHTSKLCKRRVLQSLKKTKALACNSTYGVSGVIRNVRVENKMDTNILRINLTVRKWLGGSTGMPAGGQSLVFSIDILRTASTNCTQHLPKQAKVMVFFDNEPRENKVTVQKASKVFLFGHSARREQDMLSCRSKV